MSGNSLTLREKAMVFRDTLLDTYRLDRSWEIPCPLYAVFREDHLFGITELSAPRREQNKRLRDAVALASDMAGVTSFMHVSEAYMKTEMSLCSSTETDEEGLPTLNRRLADDPESVEVLMFYCGDREGNRLMMRWSFNRSAPDMSDFLTNEDVQEWNVNVPAESMQVTSPWDLWDRPSLRAARLRPEEIN